MQLSSAHSCPFCGSYQLGGHAIVNSSILRCPACQASASHRPRKTGLLTRVRRHFAAKPDGIRPPRMPYWG